MADKCNSIIIKFLEHFENQVKILPITNGSKILLAVSGGVDSMVMLDLFNSIKRKFNIEIGVASFNHKLRKEADEEITFVKEICNALNIPFHTSSEDARKFSQEQGLSLEEGARILRYKFLNKVADEYNYNYVATAHNANDLLETVLLRLTKGTGPFGLASMKVHSERFLKPLLSFKRSEIEKYASCKNLKYVVDKSNFDIHYNRNFIRHEIIPKLKELNPSVEHSALRLVNNLWEADSFIQSLLDKHTNKKNRTFRLENYLIFKLPDEEFLKVELIRRNAISFLGKPVDYEKLERFKNTLRSGRTSFKISFWKEIGIEVSRGWCIMGNIEKYPTFSEEFILNDKIPERTYNINGYFIKISKCDIMNSKQAEITLRIQNWKEGDRLINGKKVKEIFDKEQVPTFIRRLVPMVALIKTSDNDFFERSKSSNNSIIYIPYLYNLEKDLKKINVAIEAKGGFHFEP